jgi:oligopeptide/dipeptide ABC transporter ATP-binding protein
MPDPRESVSPAEPLLEVRNLRVGFATRHGPVEAVENVSFEIRGGETLAVVGESGSGKSVTALSILRLHDRAEVTGSITFRGRDLLGIDETEMRQIRGNEIAMIFQDPMTSLDPLYNVRNQIAETLRFHRPIGRIDANRRAVELLREVGIPDPDQRARSFPHQLSGGQRQRVMVAIALACSPSLLIADEPTTALDVTVEAQILRLIRGLQAELGMSMLLITHDMGVVAEMADRVVVMYGGQVVEQGTVDEVLLGPQNPYTAALLQSIPRRTAPRAKDLPAIKGAVPSLHAMPSGCRFHPRCPHTTDQCRAVEPPVVEIGPGRVSRCWLSDPAFADEAAGRTPAAVSTEGADHGG